MNQNDQSPDLPAEKSSASASILQKEASFPLAHDAFQTPPLDFHTAEFNCIDDLNDLSGNYRSFQTLDGVVTADMRHQMERQPAKASLDLPADTAGDLTEIAPEIKEAEAVEASAPLFLISKGRTLIVDTDVKRAVTLGKILNDQRLSCTLVVIKSPSADTSVSRVNRPGYLEVEGLSISGAFGGFLATATQEGDQQNLIEAMDDQQAVFDLVLDLQSRPSYEGDCLPIGYYAPGASRTALEQAMTELPELRGQFRKPQFTSFRKNRCFHGRSADRDCRRCLEICPFGAIRSLNRRISINPYLCQGCGGCVLVCPAEAIRWNEPSPEELPKQLRSRLANRATISEFPIALVIFDSEWSGLDENSNDQTVYFQVEQIARVGLEILLAALAFGADEVLVVCGSQNAPGIKKAVEWQIEMARTILQGLGLPEDKIRFVLSSSESPGPEKKALKPFGLDGPAIDSPGPRATFSPEPDKRRMVRLAGQHLYNQSGAGLPGLPLPMGAPFGTITVNRSDCTLCLACVAACPSQALSAGGQIPQLKIRESLCHQCGLCQETCPEGAIHLLPRLLCDLEAADTSAILQEVEPFRCIECGLPFATPAMIKRMQEKLLGHWMYTDERQIRRLRMCGTCRARDALMSEDLRVWNR